MHNVLRLIHEEDGQSLVEYGLILALVAVGLIAALTTLKAQITNVFNKVGASLQNAK
jgi:pilus assembly protein Flp/PilA